MVTKFGPFLSTLVVSFRVNGWENVCCLISNMRRVRAMNANLSLDIFVLALSSLVFLILSKLLLVDQFIPTIAIIS